jgi:hypothetical protein
MSHLQLPKPAETVNSSPLGQLKIDSARNYGAHAFVKAISVRNFES